MKTITQAGPYLQLFRQMCWKIDKDIVTPVQQGNTPSKEVLEKWFLKWGEWDKVTEEITNCLEDEDYYSHQVYELERDKQEAENDVQMMTRGIEDAIDKLLDTETTSEQELEELVIMVSKDLKKLI